MNRLDAPLAIEGGSPARTHRLPLHKPWFDEREQSPMLDVLAGSHVAGDDAKGRELARLIRAWSFHETKDLVCGEGGALKAEGMSAAFHYIPLHSAPYARQSGDIAQVELP